MFPADFLTEYGTAGNFVWLLSTTAKSSGFPLNYFPHENP